MGVTPGSELEGCILSMARTGLRTLCLAVRELPREQGLPDGYLEAPPDEDMTLCAIVGIKVGAPDVRLLCLCEAAACSSAVPRAQGSQYVR